MTLTQTVHQGLRAVRGKGPGSWARNAWKRHLFRHAPRAHLFQGVFGSFQEAVASTPGHKPLSYDNAASASMYRDRLFIDEHDYPAIFWIAESLREGMRTVADVGGAVGIKYFAFQKVLDWPEGLRWQVIDMPAVAEEGRRFADELGASPDVLCFSDELQDADGVDLFYASGVLQYLDKSLPEILQGYAKKPRRLLINTTPIHEQHAYFTLNSIGTAYCGYRIEAREAFIEAIEAQGYLLRDDWINAGKKMEIIGSPEYSLDHYSGFCFDRV
ncbi:MAG: TIGR04325 family methyltransferase [Lautropia sp.]|nr:TIGR04325 family methyltransferase [Lautropia sp.]